ncbi:MAG TPA: hypothetical protein VKG38_10320 [Solirubrobacteraceae bacterium]|nr:hypothetical protein [Solirubrobacteraceae bacterium]
MVQERLELGMGYRELREVLDAGIARGVHDAVSHLGLSGVHRRPDMDDQLGALAPAVSRVKKVAHEGLRRSPIEELLNVGGNVERLYALPAKPAPAPRVCRFVRSQR